MTLTSIRRDVAEKLAELGFDPIIKLVEIHESTKDEGIRCKTATELAKYVAPQKKAIEHSGTDGGPIQIIYSPEDARL